MLICFVYRTVSPTVTGLFHPTHSNKSVSQVEVAVDEEHVNVKKLSTRNSACPEVEPVVDDGQRCLVDLLRHVPDHSLRGRHQSDMNGALSTNTYILFTVIS